MTIRSVGAATTRDLSNEEIDALQKDASTSAILNEARRKAGDRGRDVSVDARDAGLAKQIDTNKEIDFIAAAAAAADASGMAGAVGVGAEVTAGGLALASVTIVGLPLASLAASQYGLASMQGTKTDTRDAATRDVMRGAMLLSLELPAGYVASAMPRDVSTSARSPAGKMSAQIQATPLGATLQLHCDQGMRAAQDFLASPKSKAEFFAGFPKLAERYDGDPAFKAGFDALVWAKEKSPADHAQMIENLGARDARYAAVNVRVSA